MSTDVLDRPETTTPPPGADSETPPQPKRWTVEEYLHLGELGIFDDQRVELIDGEILSISPSGQHKRWTIDEYFRLGELGFLDDWRYELIDGEIYHMSPISGRHSLVSGLAADALRLTFGTTHFVREANPFPASESCPEPDVAVIEGRRRDYTDHPRVAVLLVEVSETTLRYDTREKASLYAAAGVEDYWVIDIPHRVVFVFRNPQQDESAEFGYSYSRRTRLSESDTVVPLAAPTATPISVAALLP